MNPSRFAMAAGVPALLAGFGLAIPLLLLGAAGGAAEVPPQVAWCGAGGTGTTVAGVMLDAEQLGNARTILTVTAGRGFPATAAVIALTAAYTESRLRNTTVQLDHDSEGLFQQRVSFYSAPVAADPVRATNAFLDRLAQIPDWPSQPPGALAQAVQISAYPDRYAANVALAQQLVGRYWPAAAAAAAAVPNENPHLLPPIPPICPGGGGAGVAAGATGTMTDGTANPAGLVLTGTAAGQIAVRYGLAQLGRPYVFGTAGPDAFDCSGLTMAAWAAAGVALPHLAAAQAGAGTPGPANLSQALGGDLVFIAGADGTAAAPGHVGMIVGYADRPDGRHLYLIQAAQSGVPVEITDTRLWHGLIVAVRHVA